MELFDSHSHYNDEKFNEDRDEIIKTVKEFGVTKFIVAGYDVKSSKLAVEIANENEGIYAIVGISPNDIPGDIQEIEKLASDKKVVAIGEIGLDYYWNKENKDLQREAFIKQIELANKLNLPIVIHCRDAVQDTIDIIKLYRVDKAGVFHCCMPNQELIKEALKLGYYISIAGPVTYKNAINYPDAVKLIPDDRLLIETDCPYLTPEPNRGKRNDSRNLIYIAKKIAEIRECSVEKIAELTYENAKRAFGIEK